MDIFNDLVGHFANCGSRRHPPFAIEADLTQFHSILDFLSLELYL